MKRIFKVVLTTTLIFAMILSGTFTAFGAQTDGIKMQYNGEEITFTDAAVKMTDGRVVVPFRQILETMGADVTYDAKTKTITAKTTEKEFSFAIGGTEIAITEDGIASTKEMDVAPFIDKNLGSTYVPVRFIAQTMGYCVGWDSVEKTVVIIDPATIFANTDEDFSVISKLMKSDLDLGKPYATTGKFDVDVTTYADPESIMPGMNFSVAGKISRVQQKQNADLAMSLAFNFEKMLSSMTAEEKTQIEPLLSMFKNADMKIKMDGESGITYMNSSLFTTMDPTMDENTWYKMNVYDTHEEMGIDLKSIYAMKYSSLDFSELLEGSISQMKDVDTSTYEGMKTTYALLKSLIGDEAFIKKTAGSYVTYTLDLNKTSIIAAMAKIALTEGISKDTLDMTEIADTLKSVDFGVDLMIKEKNGSLSAYDLKGTCSSEEMNCTFALAGNQKNAEGNITIDMKDAMKMIMDLESHISETSQTPDISLPADATVVDYQMPTANEM